MRVLRHKCVYTSVLITAQILYGQLLSGQVNVLTYQYDQTRAGANRNETLLAPANVNTTQFGKLFSRPVDGVIYGQPLVMTNLAIPGLGVHNVVYVATEHDSVYAFDADSNTGANSAPLWKVSFLAPGVTTVPNSDVGCDQITPEIGITSTPVIDPAAGTIYVVAMTKETTGTNVTYVHRLHALDVTTGAERPNSPVVIQASVPGTADGGQTVNFVAKNYKQRTGLVLLNGNIYTAWASHCDLGKYHGWLIAYNATTLAQTAVYNNTPNGDMASFWAGGAAPAVDAAGNMFLVGGNGTFDSNGNGMDDGESYLKLSTTGGLKLVDYFTPYNYADLNNRDLDVGSTGVALLGDEAGSPQHPHLMTGAGKEGRLYLIDRDNMGKLNAGSDSQIVQSLPNSINSIYGNPAYFNKTVYYCGVHDAIKAFSISNAVLPTYRTSEGPTLINFPGCVPSISANGTSNGIVWALDPGGQLRAYDASNLATELYNSDQNKNRDALGGAVKFSVPTIANGKVHAGTQTALVTYGLLAGLGPAVVNAASGDASGLAPGSIVSIYGTGLATSVASAASFPLPTSLGGASVTVNGMAAPLLYASPSQINFQLPYSVSGNAIATVTAAGTQVATKSFPIKAASPGIFLLAQGRAAAVNQDGTVNSTASAAPVGSILSLYATGLGAVNPPLDPGIAAGLPLSYVTASVTATLGGQLANIQFAGLTPGFAGLYQINLQVPPLPPGDYPVQLSVNGTPGNTATVTVR